MSDLLTHLTSPKVILWYRRAVPQPPTSVQQEFALLSADVERLGVTRDQIVRVDATGPRHSVHEPALKALEQQLAQGRVTHLAVSSVDRLTRDARRRARVLYAVAHSGAVFVVGGRVVDPRSDIHRLMLGDIAVPDLAAASRRMSFRARHRTRECVRRRPGASERFGRDLDRGSP